MLDCASVIFGSSPQMPWNAVITRATSGIRRGLLAELEPVLDHALLVLAGVEDHRGGLVSALEALVDDLVDLAGLGAAVLERVALVRGEDLELGLEREGDRARRSARPR